MELEGRRGRTIVINTFLRGRQTHTSQRRGVCAWEEAELMMREKFGHHGTRRMGRRGWGLLPLASLSSYAHQTIIIHDHSRFGILCPLVKEEKDVMHLWPLSDGDRMLQWTRQSGSGPVLRSRAILFRLKSCSRLSERESHHPAPRNGCVVRMRETDREGLTTGIVFPFLFRPNPPLLGLLFVVVIVSQVRGKKLFKGPPFSKGMGWSSLSLSQTLMIMVR